MSKVKPEDLDKHLLAIRDLVCLANNDGFGYSLSWKDALFSEKFVEPKDFKGMLKSVHPNMEHPLFEYSSGSISEGTYHENTSPLALIAHGRTSTNWKGYPDYSHPFYNPLDEMAFVHNGVVDVPKQHNFKLQTENDSEYLAELFWKEGIKGLQDTSGYFAFFNLKKNGVMEVCKDDFARLYGTFSPDLEGYIFATQESMITSYARDFKLSHSNIFPVSDNVLATIRLNKIRSFNAFKRVDKRVELNEKTAKAFKDYGTGQKQWNNQTQSWTTRSTYGNDSGFKVKSKKEVSKGGKLPAVAGGKSSDTSTAAKETGTISLVTHGKEIIIRENPPKEGAAPSESELLGNYVVDTKLKVYNPAKVTNAESRRKLEARGFKARFPSMEEVNKEQAEEDRAFVKNLIGSADLQEGIENAPYSSEFSEDIASMLDDDFYRGYSRDYL